MTDLLGHESIPDDVCASWAAFNADEVEDKESISTFISALMPLFHEQAKSVAMIQHGMTIIKDTMQFLNPGQIPLIAMDQPLFALAKQIQWDKPETYGEDKYLIMFGGLHIEMAAFKVLGDWMDGSGWPEALTQANVAGAGTADSFLKASHVARTRHAHQVTAAALYQSLMNAYDSYKSSVPDEENQMECDQWCSEKCKESPQFKYWYITLEFQLLIFIFIKSLRQRNFSLYKDALSKLLPWFFALDHQNYSRWLSVHARDMESLPQLHPQIHEEFEHGNFTLAKTNAPFSAMAIDQAHEQNNAAVKGDGGAIGLTQNPSALRRWMVAGPEMARLIQEFQEEVEDEAHVNLKHHEQTTSKQKNFIKEVTTLTKKVEDMGNPFKDSGKELYRLDSKDVIDEDVIKTLHNIQELGETQYDQFVKQRLIDRTVAIEEPIKRNKLSLFSRAPVKVKSKTDFQIATLKSNCSLFSQLYVSCLSRQSNLDDFFCHENQAYPPSLTDMGEMRSTTKSHLVDCLTEEVLAQPVLLPFDASILDGPAIVNMVQPVVGQTFEQYADDKFIPYICSFNSRRVDVVWDVYLEDSLKEHARDQRGKGTHRKVMPNVKVPNNWQGFLRDSKNKTELFRFLSQKLSEHRSEKTIITTIEKNVVTNKPESVDLSGIQPCSHEEADTRLLLHAQHARLSGYENILIRTVDTDVLVIAVAMVEQLGNGRLWLLYGKGNTTKYIDVNAIASKLGIMKAKGLPVFHALTGCDNVSSFGTIGKRTAWAAWKALPEMDEVFALLATDPSKIDELISKIERFVVVCYDRVSDRESVNEERRYLFTKKGRDIQSIPPTQAALIQQLKRAVYQGGHCWTRALDPRPEIPCPSEWGWKKERKWVPVWTTLEEACKALSALVKCGCKKGCNTRCKCKKAGLQCTALCACEDTCGQDD